MVARALFSVQRFGGLVARSDFVLAALAAGGEGRSFSPVQVQKLFFLLDREATDLIGGPHFNFSPYDYGPFDREVYGELEKLQLAGWVDTSGSSNYRRYMLSPEGFAQGAERLNLWSATAREYVTQVAEWIQKLNFQQLVSAIYVKYPDMKVNSVFR
jgi:hypothetical protein